MLTRIQKQIFIIFIGLVVIGLISYLIYLLVVPKASCGDGIKNCHQKACEKDIDCGGPCSDCLPPLENIQVEWTKAILVEDNNYNIGAKLKNPNPNYGSGLIPYKFVFYDDDNQIITEKTGSTYILPHQSKYLIETNVIIDEPFNRIELIINNNFKWQELKEGFPPPELVIEEARFELLSSDNAQIAAEVHNKSNFDFDKVIIDTILFNQQHEIITFNSMEISTLATDEKRYIEPWSGYNSAEIKDFIIEPETNIFDINNYMKKYGVSKN